MARITATNQGLACDDSNSCTVSTTCDNGRCQGGTWLNCDDGNVCTTDFCNSSSGCAHGSAADTVSCNDNDACTGSDHCTGSGTCTGYANPPVDDYNPCTLDVCNSATGITSHNPVTNGTSCNDNNVCTVADACYSGACTNSTPLNCSDNNACTVDSCSNPGGCQHAALGCDDGDPCTTDGCNVGAGCTHTTANNFSSCNDNNLCTTADHCDGLGKCTGTDVLPLDDGNFCTLDTCLSTTGETVHTAFNEGASCVSPDVCIGNATCHDGFCNGSLKSCDDSNACTLDTCAPPHGCLNIAKNCDDENVCTENDCDPAKGCVNSLKSFDDHNSCTTDICDPWAGQGHVYLGDGTPCDDGNATTQEDFCGENKCNAGLSCQPAVLTTLPQPVPPPIVRRRLGRGRHVVATSSKGQAVVFVEEMTGNGGSVMVGVATFTVSGARTGVVKFGKVPFYADPVIAALPSGDYVVAFDSVTLDGDGLAVGMVKVSSDGQLLTQPILANTTKVFGQHSADIIWTGTELRMAWEDESEPGHRRLCERRFKADLSPITGEECGTSAPEYDRSRVSLTTVGLTPVTAWQETWQETFEPFNTKRSVQLRLGAAQTSFDMTAAPQDESPALVELDASHVLMVYPDTDGTQRAVVVDDAGNVDDTAALNEAGEPRYTPVLTKVGEQVYMAWMSPPALLDGGWDPDLDDVFVQKLAWNQGVLDLNANPKFSIPFSESYRFGDQRNPAIAPRLFNGKNAMWTAWEDFRDDKTQTNHGDVLVSIRVLP